MANETIRDFYLECKMYEHSQECFDLMKECMELQLEEKYLQNEVYAVLNEEAITAAGAQQYFEASLFSKKNNKEESTPSDDKVEKINQSNEKVNSFKEKASKIWNKIVTKAINLWNRFLAFLKKVYNHIKDGKTINDELIKVLKKCNLTEDDAYKLEECIAKEKDFVVDIYDQPAIKGLNIPTGDAKMRNTMLAVLSTTYVMIAPATTPLNLVNKNQLISTSDLVKFAKEQFKSVENGTKNIKADAEKAKLQKLAEKNKTTGIKLEVSPSVIEKQIADLQALIDTAKKQLTEVIPNSDIPVAMKDVYQLMVNNIGTQIAMMNNFIAWRKESCQKLLEAAKKLCDEKAKPEYKGESATAEYENVMNFMYG